MASDAEIQENYSRWTDAHGVIARSQGWDMFDYDSRNLLQLQRLDLRAAFETDQDAIDFVTEKAAKGDATAKLALDLDAFFQPIIYPEMANADDAGSAPSL
jgi:hypothetical protein